MNCHDIIDVPFYVSIPLKALPCAFTFISNPSLSTSLVSRLAGHFQDLVGAFALSLNAETAQLRLGIVHKLIDFG